MGFLEVVLMHAEDFIGTLQQFRCTSCHSSLSLSAVTHPVDVNSPVKLHCIINEWVSLTELESVGLCFISEIDDMGCVLCTY